MNKTDFPKTYFSNLIDLIQSGVSYSELVYQFGYNPDLVSLAFEFCREEQK